MAFTRYEVWIEEADEPIDKVWGPADSLSRAREVAQAGADATGLSHRIDALRYKRLGDKYPECDYYERFDPAPAGE